MDFNREKFKTLVHYVIWKAGTRDSFGATKLNKVLWFADARAYVLTGASITGATYIREKWGPVPKQMMPIRAELEREGAIKVSHSRDDGNHTKFTAVFAPIVSILSEGDLQTVNYWITHIDKNHTAKSISDESHDYSWQIAKMGEELPFFSFLSTRIREPNDEELAWAKSRAQEKRLP